MAGRGVSLSAQLQTIVAAALKANFVIPEKQAWVKGFIIESVIVECLDGEGVPADVEAAVAMFSPLFFDNLDDVDAQDVRDFCALLSERFQELLADDDGSGSESDEVGGCAMCERDMPLTKHHLIPRDVHSNYKKKGYTTEQLNAGLMVCRPCHSAIHRTFDNKTLASDYASLEKLMQSEDLQRFIGWAKKQRTTRRSDVQGSHLRYRR